MHSNGNKICFTILYKLWRHGYIGGRHTSIDNIQKGFPKHVRGEVKKNIRNLIKEGTLISKRTKKGEHVSIAPKKIKDVGRIIEEFN